MAPRLAALVLLAAVALAASARAQQKENPDPAGYVPLSSCTNCHKTAFPANAKSHAGNKICQPPARWITSGGYCCGGTTGSHCPNEGGGSSKDQFGFPTIARDKTYVAPPLGVNDCEYPTYWVLKSPGNGFCCNPLLNPNCGKPYQAPPSCPFPEAWYETAPGKGYCCSGLKFPCVGTKIDAPVVYSPPKKTPTNNAGAGTKKPTDVKKPTGTGTKKPAAAVAYWCDPAAGKIVAVPPGKAPKDGTKVSSKTSPCVKAAAKTGTDVVAAPPLPLLDAAPERVETRWLTKAQNGLYTEARAAATGDAGHKAVDDQYRKLVKEQIRPEAADAYATAIAAPAAEQAAKIKAAIGSVEMWGGPNAAIVGLYQEKADPKTAKLLEIQLSKADYELIKTKFPAALEAYKVSRGAADGRYGDKFKESMYDPIALRLSLVAALKSINKEAPGAKKKEAEKPKDDTTPAGGILTKEELAVLTPKELKTYQALLDAATINGKVNEKDPNLLKEAARLRALIAKEERLKAKEMPASSDMTEAQFNALPLFQKQKFCKDYRGVNGSAAAKDTKSKELDNGANAKKGLESSAPTVGSGKKNSTPASSTAWSKEDRIAACGKVPEDGPGAIDGDTHADKGSLTGNVPAVPNDVDKDDEAKGKNKWLTEPLIISAVQGSLVGLLIGSLFGPLGLILGPIIGAVAFYGISKLKE